MLNVKNLLIASSFVILAACSTVDPVEIHVQKEDKVQLNLSDPLPVRPKKIEWFVITPENIQAVMEALGDENNSMVLFGVTSEGYEDLALNLTEIRKYLIEQKHILEAYREYYEPKKEE